MTDIAGLIAEVKRLWRSEAFWFGFWEMLSLRAVLDPIGHRRRFEELLRRRRALAQTGGADE